MKYYIYEYKSLALKVLSLYVFIYLEICIYLSANIDNQLEIFNNLLRGGYRNSDQRIK